MSPGRGPSVAIATAAPHTDCVAGMTANDVDVHQRYGIVGRSRGVAEVIRLIDLVSATRSTVLITGETVPARNWSRARFTIAVLERADALHHKLNCAAIPARPCSNPSCSGTSRARSPTRLADEERQVHAAPRPPYSWMRSGAMDVRVQTKLLRVIESREFEMLGAEHRAPGVPGDRRDQPGSESAGRGRAVSERSWYCLHVVPIVVPPLRERRDDIPMLVEYFAHKHAIRVNKTIEGFEHGAGSVLPGV